MKAVLVISASLILACSVYLNFFSGLTGSGKIKEYMDSGSRFISDKSEEYFYTKQLKFNGLKRLNSSELEKHLPLDKSVIWWLSNTNQIEKLLLSNPMLDKARVSACSYTEWGCFNISLTERKPEYIALLGNTPWLIGKDGGFISPVSSLADENSALKVRPQELVNAIQITGLLERGYSPDILEVKINYLSSVVGIIENKIKYKISRIEFNSDADIIVKFITERNSGQVFSAKFNSPKAELSVIEDQAARLRKILSAYAGHIADIEVVDLAYDKIAVVKKTEAATQEAEKLAKSAAAQSKSGVAKISQKKTEAKPKSAVKKSKQH